MAKRLIDANKQEVPPQQEGDRCAQCVYRAAELAQNRCDYAVVTGRTRRAQPAASCTFFQAGKRIFPPVYPPVYPPVVCSASWAERGGYA